MSKFATSIHGFLTPYTNLQCHISSCYKLKVPTMELWNYGIGSQLQISILVTWVQSGNWYSSWLFQNCWLKIATLYCFLLSYNNFKVATINIQLCILRFFGVATIHKIAFPNSTTSSSKVAASNYKVASQFCNKYATFTVAASPIYCTHLSWPSECLWECQSSRSSFVPESSAANL